MTEPFYAKAFIINIFKRVFFTFSEEVFLKHPWRPTSEASKHLQFTGLQVQHLKTNVILIKRIITVMNVRESGFIVLLKNMTMK